MHLGMVRPDHVGNRKSSVRDIGRGGAETEMLKQYFDNTRNKNRLHEKVLTESVLNIKGLEGPGASVVALGT